MTDTAVGPADAEVLLDLAEATLARALTGQRVALPALQDLPPALHAEGGAFVTLTVAGELNGCIGAIESPDPLGHSVVRLALSAAFEDPRLPQLRPADFAGLTIEVSLLSPLTPLEVDSRAELLAAVEPGIDGVVIEAGRARGLFLPSVWEQLPDPDDFLDQLWRKAGLAPRRWPPGLEAFRFGAAKYGRRATAHAARFN